MNVTLETKPFADAVSLLSGMESTGMSGPLNVVGHTLITDRGDGTVTLAVCDYDLGARVGLVSNQPVLTGTEDAVSVSLQILLKQVRSIADLADTVNLKRTANNRLVLKTKRTQAQIAGVDPNCFPEVLFDMPEPDLELDAKDLQHLLQVTLPSCDKAQFNTAKFTGISLTAAGDFVRASSTDERRMTVCTLAIPARQSAFSAFLPKPLVEHVLRVAGHAGKEATVAFAKGTRSHQIFVRAGDAILAGREIGIPFPDLSPWTRMTDDKRVVVSIAEMESVLNAAMPFATTEHDKTKTKIDMEYSDGALRMQCCNKLTGEFEATLSASTFGVDSFRFAIDGIYLRDALHSVGMAGDEVAMTLSADNLRQMQFRAAKGMEVSNEVRTWVAGMWMGN